MNKVILIGRLSKDVELRFTQSNKAVTSFSIAVDKRKKEEGADFFNCVAWGTIAENMNRYLAKGSKVAVYGRLSTRSYEKNGSKQYVTEVVADEVEFLDSKNHNQQPSQNFQQINDDDELPF